MSMDAMAARVEEPVDFMRCASSMMTVCQQMSCSRAGAYQEASLKIWAHKQQLGGQKEKEAGRLGSGALLFEARSAPAAGLL
jgi:hypothetical protein